MPQACKKFAFKSPISLALNVLCVCFVMPVLLWSNLGLADPVLLNTPTTNTEATPATGGALTVSPPEQQSSQAPIMKPSEASDVNSGMIVTPSVPSPPPATSFVVDPDQLRRQSEQAALQAQAQIEAQAAKEKHDHNVMSFENASDALLPLSPDQVRDFMHHFETVQNAALPPFEGQPKGQVRIATLSLDPGIEPPELNLSPGYVTTINMVDATGEPWPILDVGVGGNFEVSPTAAGSHVVRVMPLTRVARGNLSILLKDLPTPVIFKLSSGGATVDLRYDARIGKMGPGAKPSLIARQQLEAGNETIMLLLANAPPTGAKRLKVGGLDSRSMAWALDGHVFVRTPLTLLSPAWDASASSADGMTVYEIGDAPVLLMSENGAMVRARLIRDDDHDK